MITIALLMLAASPYRIDPIPHAISIAGQFAVIGILEAAVKPTLAAPSPQSPTALTWADRGAQRLHSPAWRTTSDVLLISSLVLPFAADGVDAYLSDGTGWGAGWGTDALVMGEATVTALTLTELWKYAVHRPRPALYGDRGPYAPDDGLSFPSGHASLTGAILGAYTTTYFLRHPDTPARYGVLGGAITLTALTATGRVLGGKHFPTDVVAGALLGGTVGFLVPYLARQRILVIPSGNALEVRISIW